MVFGGIRHIFFEKDYIRYFLTGVVCTDYIEAQGSMLFDCNRNVWDEELCAALDLPVNMLPEARSNSEIYGTVAADIPGLEALATRDVARPEPLRVCINSTLPLSRLTRIIPRLA